MNALVQSFVSNMHILIMSCHKVDVREPAIINSALRFDSCNVSESMANIASKSQCTAQVNVHIVNASLVIS